MKSIICFVVALIGIPTNVMGLPTSLPIMSSIPTPTNKTVHEPDNRTKSWAHNITLPGLNSTFPPANLTFHIMNETSPFDFDQMFEMDTIQVGHHTLKERFIPPWKQIDQGMGPNGGSWTKCYTTDYRWRGLNQPLLRSCAEAFHPKWNQHFNKDWVNADCGGRNWYSKTMAWVDSSICWEMCYPCIDSAIRDEAAGMRCAIRKHYAGCVFDFDKDWRAISGHDWGYNTAVNQAMCDNDLVYGGC